ncbi:tetratricopeptide repeat protein [Marinicella sediminis]|uniref:Tetratricopeptide repeat protein n=1 Tax=Marinicella sediminis TaxID=1792834 RepID=A0ABV7J7J1_9GAMM|nr:hypothetical protein [Marinicella sediminis]
MKKRRFINRFLPKVWKNYGDTGRIDELNELLKNAVDEQDKTATDYFVLGNMFFGGYPELSVHFMKKAEQLLPDNPAIHFERAIQEHARDNCVDAVKYYDRFFESDFGATHATARARGAECYLKTGRYSDAIDSWIAADHGDNHISIEKAIFSMYEGEPYFSLRLKLLNKIIKGNETDLFPELISMDLNWRRDWWNIDVNEKHLVSDMTLASKMLSDDEYQKLVVMTHLEKLDKSKEDMLQLLDESNLWNESSSLPKSDVLMYHLIFYLSKQGIVKTDELLSRFESELRERVFNENEHSKNLDILAFIYSETDEDKLREIDRLGWKKYHLPNYALSLLLAEKDEAKFEALLNEMAQDFPYEPQIALLRLSRNKDKNKETELMANMVIGEYKNVQNRFNSYQLKDYMYSLAKQIKHRVYTDNLNRD